MPATAPAFWSPTRATSRSPISTSSAAATLPIRTTASTSQVTCRRGPTNLSVSNVSVEADNRASISWEATAPRDFDNVSVRYVTADNNGNGGVPAPRDRARPATSISATCRRTITPGRPTSSSGFRHPRVRRDDVVIGGSVTGDNGWLPGNHGETGGIEAINDNRVLLQYNEAYDNHHGNSDGDGIILDVTNDSIMQFNYSRDNDGAGLFVYAETGATSTNNIIRYNISQNDARHAAEHLRRHLRRRVSSTPRSTATPSSPGPRRPPSSPAAIRLLGLSGNSVHVYNNMFETTGGVPWSTGTAAAPTSSSRGTTTGRSNRPLPSSRTARPTPLSKPGRCATGEGRLDNRSASTCPRPGRRGGRRNHRRRPAAHHADRLQAAADVPPRRCRS